MNYQDENLERVAREEADWDFLIKQEKEMAYMSLEEAQSKNVEEVITGVQDLYLASKKLDRENGLG